MKESTIKIRDEVQEMASQIHKDTQLHALRVILEERKFTLQELADKLRSSLDEVEIQGLKSNL